MLPLTADVERATRVFRSQQGHLWILALLEDALLHSPLYGIRGYGLQARHEMLPIQATRPCIFVVCHLLVFPNLGTHVDSTLGADLEQVHLGRTCCVDPHAVLLPRHFLRRRRAACLPFRILWLDAKTVFAVMSAPPFSEGGDSFPSCLDEFLLEELCAVVARCQRLSSVALPKTPAELLQLSWLQTSLCLSQPRKVSLGF